MRLNGAAKQWTDQCSRGKNHGGTAAIASWKIANSLLEQVGDISRFQGEEEDQQSIPLLLQALKACGSFKNLEAGRRIHCHAIESGIFPWSSHISNTIVSMYFKCGSLLDATNAFESIPWPGLASWTILISGYANNGRGDLALEIFDRMEEQGFEADARAYVAALIACGNLARKEGGGIDLADGQCVKLRCLDKGMALHSRALRNGCIADTFVACTLVDMYAKCGSLLDARKVFDRMTDQDVVAWNSLILGYAENGEEDLALDVFWCMKFPNSRTFLAAVLACGNLAMKEESKLVDGKLVKVRSLEKGILVHTQAEKSSGGVDIFVASGLVGMYSKCGSMESAGLVFERVPRKDMVLWNSFILGLVDNGEPELALKTFKRMQSEGWAPNCRTFVAALMAYAALAARDDYGTEPRKRFLKAEFLQNVKDIHSQAAKAGCEFDVFVASTLVDSYAKCGSLENAREVFSRMPLHDLVTWNSLIMGHADNGQGELALEWFQRMRSRGCVLDARAFLSVLMGCINIAVNSEESLTEVADNRFVKVGCLEKGMAVHSLALEHGCESDIFVASALVEFYIKCGSLFDARIVFDRIPFHNAVLWTTLLMGYAEKDEPELALELYARMESASRAANTRIFVAGLTACSSLAVAEIGRRIHAETCRVGVEKDPFVANSLLDMYCKCGILSAAEHIFDSVCSRTIVTWSAIIAGYGREGETELVFELFHAMVDAGVQPNEVTCLLMLSACGHAGFIDKGTRFFNEMSSKFGVPPSLEHYHSVIDMLGRANRLEEALDLASNMPWKSTVLTWKTVLGGCWKWKNVKIGKLAFEKLLELNDKQASAYIMMANIYRTVGVKDEESHIVEWGGALMSACI